MTQELLKEILEKHLKWLKNEPGGSRADLSSADLSSANLICANLSSANLRRADLSSANLSSADLSRANLSSANLRRADLSSANLSSADLSSADLSRADLRRANLSSADLSSANLICANLSSANLICADLSQVKNLITAINYLDAHYEKTADGYIAYKTIGEMHDAPKDWKNEKGSVISEIVNPDRCTECGSGINVATLDWVKNHMKGEIWKVLIRWEWAAGIVVPYMTDGKIRCERCELVEVVGK